MSQVSRRWVLGGGLASGKSLVEALLGEAGVATIDADQVGHEVLLPDGPAFAEVARRWPEAVRDGEIDRRSLAQLVFSDRAELAELESLTHPHIFDMIRVEVEQIEGPVVVEIPLIHHGLGDDWGQIVVDCHDELRLERALSRGMDEQDARSRISTQPSRGEWLAAADLVIPNHGSPSDLRASVTVLSRLL